MANWKSFGRRTAWLRLVMKTLAVRDISDASRSYYAIYNSYMAPRVQYVRLPRSLSVSSGS